MGESLVGGEEATKNILTEIDPSGNISTIIKLMTVDMLFGGLRKAVSCECSWP